MKHHEHLPLLPIARGEGMWLVDFDGKRYLDAISSWWVNLFGHANRESTRRSSTSSAKLDDVMLADSPTSRWCNFPNDCRR
jgi:adenosylmethionine-8-amino-7-oxononanoate aminotransferase